MKKNTIDKQAEKVIKKTADFTKNNTKDLAIVALLIGGAYLLYRSVKNAANIADNLIPTIGNNPGDGGGNVNPTGNTPPNDGGTITPNQAQAIAAGLHQAMVILTGTDEARIFALLDGKNPVDFVKISNAFGSPRYDGFADAYWPFAKHNLTYWIQSELNDQELNHLQQIMPGVF
jgi:hypothetical protein